MSSTAPIPVPAAALELEDEIKPYRERIERIDKILKGPVQTLIREARKAADTMENAETMLDRAPRFPLWIAKNPVRNPWRNALTTSLCLVTLHRLNRMRRRFPHLKDDTRELGETLGRLRVGYLPDRADLKEGYFAACAPFVDSRTFGFLNPFSSAQVFRLLMESGEDHAHTGVGCLSFFAMVWPLFRRTEEDPLDIGARIEPYRPTAYVTAKCLLPLIELREICLKRARLFRDILRRLHTLAALRADAAASSLSHWTFCAEMDSLRHHLNEMAEISISPTAFATCDRTLEGPLRALRPGDPVDGLFNAVVRELGRALQSVEARSAELLGDAECILKTVRADIVAPLVAGTVPSLPRRTREGDLSWEARRAGGEEGFDLSAFRFDFPETAPLENYADYLKALGEAGGKASALCESILEELKKAASLGVQVLAESPDDAAVQAAIACIDTALTDMARVNGNVATHVSGPVDLHTRWCHTVVNRHVAFAAARNFTDFDASELVSGLAVVVRDRELMAEGQVADALEKAVVAREPDGSWRLGHPYFSADGLQALRAPAADVVWTLVSAVARFPGIQVADPALFSFVEWLERTGRELSTGPDPMAQDKVFGWSADQMREQDRVELFTTAYAVNALLAVRDLAEHRLWELCERRFTIIKDSKRLDQMAPVDLMVPHGRRLHSRLGAMMRHNRTASPDAVYSMVLHGPPGSSKTTVAGALSHAMGSKSGRWGRERRLVRVTPADFTRLGEDRVDAQAHAIFELLRHVRGATILFDEIDDLLRRREFAPDNHPRFLDLVIPAMLNRLQDLRDACDQQEICFLFGTNYVERIEPALMRRGRIDEIIPVPYPDVVSRCAIAEGVLDASEILPRRLEGPQAWRDAWKQELLKGAAEVARQTGGWSWSGVRGIAKKVRGEIAGGFARDPDTPLMPVEVVTGRKPDGATHWAEFVERQVIDNPPDIRTDTIYPERLHHGMESRELRHESLRHFLTYCQHPKGYHLLKELQAQINQLAEVSDVKKLHIDTGQFLAVLGLLDDPDAATRNGAGAGA